MPIDTIIFDVGNVLHVFPDRKGRHRVFSELGLCEPVQEKKWWNLYKVGTCNEKAYWEGTLKDTPLQGKEDEVAGTVRNLFAGMTANGAVVYLPRLQAQGYNLAILSNHVTEWLRPFLEHNTLEKYFSDIIISSEVKLAKPDKRIYEYTLQQLRRAPEQVLFIDDKEENVAAARSVGIYSIQFHDCAELEKELMKYEVKL